MSRLFSEAQIRKVFDTVLAIDSSNCLPAVTVPAKANEAIFDCFEIDPVVNWLSKDGSTNCEALNDISDLPQHLESDTGEVFDGLIWTVFAHLKEGGRECIHDFQLRSEAEAAYETLTNILAK